MLFDKTASVHFIRKKYIYILALEMASPGNQHCASCIGTLSFLIAEWQRSEISEDPPHLRYPLYQSTVSACADMAPPGRPADAHFGPYKNTSIIEPAERGHMMRNLFARSNAREAPAIVTGEITQRLRI